MLDASEALRKAVGRAGASRAAWGLIRECEPRSHPRWTRGCRLGRLLAMRTGDRIFVTVKTYPELSKQRTFQIVDKRDPRPLAPGTFAV